MKKLVLVTGGTGHVGSVLISELLRRRERVRVLALPGHEQYLPDGVEVVLGDIRRKETLAPFFEAPGSGQMTLIHCAAKITIASADDPEVWDTNVNGTENVMEMALSGGVDRTVYVSSVHAIPERPKGEVITEVRSFSPDLVHGQYAKSKAAAAQLVLDYARRGLNVSIVHPSGIIGPGDDRGHNHMIRTIRAMAEGRIPMAVRGGYDFVDSRDVVSGILGCETHGRAGECYILSGWYITVLELLNRVRALVGKRPGHVEVPHALAGMLATLAERLAARAGREAPLFTPYSVYTLNTNGRFSHERASREFGYSPRDLDESIRASLG